MKAKLLFAIVALSAQWTMAADEASPIKMDVKGAARFRFERNDRTDYASDRSAFHFRIRPEMRLSRGSDLSIFVQPQFARSFGKPEYPGATTTTNTAQGTSGTAYDGSLMVHQAMVDYKASSNFQFMVGRQVLSYGDELVLGGLDWDNISRSFDALRMRVTHGSGNVDVFYSKLWASRITATATASGDSDFYGLYSANNFGSGLSATDLYFLYRGDQTTGPKNEMFAVGLRIKDKMGSFDYRLEGTKEAGSQFVDTADAYQADLEVGISFDSGFKGRIGLEGFLAGKHYDSVYPTGHKWLGIADVIGRRNIQGGALKLSATPSEGWTANLDVHLFQRASTSAPAYKLSGAALGTGTSSSSAIGTEFDAILTYAISKEISATLGGGMLLPGQYLKDEFSDFNPLFWYTQWTVAL